MRPVVMLAAAFAISHSDAALACDRDDIAILQSNWRVDGEYVRVVGELKNSCSTETGIQLQAIYRKSSGEIIHVTDFWPASTNNVRAGESFGFSTLQRIANQGVASVDVKVIAVQQWKPR